MVTEEEKREIIDRAVEKAMLLLPEVIGNLMQERVALLKLNSEFYKAHPEFREHRDCVQGAVEEVEMQNPLEKYEQIMEKAVPKIRERIRIKESLNMKPMATVNRDFKDFSPPDVQKVGSHGEL
jgi:hypothetical protein